MQYNRFSLISQLARKPIAFVFVLLFAGVGASLIAFSRAATEATITLTPATKQVSVGETIDVTVSANSNTTQVNAVQADLSFDPAKLEFVSIDAATSGFSIEAEHSSADGKVTVARGSIANLSGNQTIAVVRLKALVPGTVAVNVDDTSQLLQSSDSANILTSTTGANYTVTDSTPPSIPGVATMTNSTATSIALAWTAATDNVAVTGYNVYRNGVKVGSSSSLTYTDNGLAPSNSYSYTISARDNGGNESAKSAAVSLSTKPDTTAPSVVSGLTSPSQTPTSVTLNWTAATDDVGVTGYRVYRNGTQIGTTTTPSYTNSGLAPDTSYDFSITAYDVAGNVSPQSEVVAVKTAQDTTAPSTPTALSGEPVGVTAAKLTWGASSDNVAVTGYRIYRDGSQIATSTSTTFTVNDLELGSTYSFTVAAYDAAGNVSAQTAAVTVKLTLKQGDNNADNKIDLIDLSILLANYGGENPTRLMGDQNGDGVINLFDLSMLLSNWGT